MARAREFCEHCNLFHLVRTSGIGAYFSAYDCQDLDAIGDRPPDLPVLHINCKRKAHGSQGIYLDRFIFVTARANDIFAEPSLCALAW